MENIKTQTLGGDFVIKQTLANTVFTPEDFSEEQLMMKESVIEFVDRDIVPNRERFEQKDFDFRGVFTCPTYYVGRALLLHLSVS